MAAGPDSPDGAVWETSAPSFGRPGRRAVYAHRGASGYRPEHTLEAYRLAIAQGADQIEPDLVMTRDGQLVVRHENEIGGTTDVARHPRFAARRTTKTVGGRAVAGWFSEDFTLAELRTLRAIERLPELRPRNAAFDGRFRVPTLLEVIELARDASREHGRTIGIVPEIKHATYFRAIGLDPEATLLDCLRRAGLDDRRAPVLVQSFEVATLQRLRRASSVPTVQLLAADGIPADVVAAGGTTSYAEMATPAGLAATARYADAVAPSSDLIVPRDPSGRSLAPTAFVADAHAVGLPVAAWTFRRENAFLPLERRVGTDPAAPGDLQGYVASFLELGVDAVFSDHPDVGVGAVRAFEAVRGSGDVRPER